MIDLLVAGGWVMPLIVACSVVALIISIERYIALDRSKVAPPPMAHVLKGTPFPADAENLRAIIIEKTGSRRDIPVSIVADGDTPACYGASMDTVSQLGFKRLSISTQRPAAGE